MQQEIFQFGNTNIIIETGNSPEKITVGKHQEYLSYRQGQDKIHLLQIEINGEKTNLFPYSDVYWQASTRGGRPIDKISKSKVVFKDVSQTVGKINLNIAEDIYLYGSSKNDSGRSFSFCYNRRWCSYFS